ncbi:MAG: helix-turn-helix domain-containing protein [Bacillota bacterium]|nr:helix-turn-helix domain-containing protein [Bacillota bacterium]
MDTKKIGAFLKELRNEINMTQEQLAERMYVSCRTVSRWETGATLPNIAILIDLSELYDVDIREILDGEKKEEIVRKEQIMEKKQIVREEQTSKEGQPIKDGQIIENKQTPEKAQFVEEKRIAEKGRLSKEEQIDKEGKIVEKGQIMENGLFVKEEQLAKDGRIAEKRQTMEKERCTGKEKENTILKVAEYNQEEKRRLIKKGQLGFIICFIFSLIKFAIEIFDLKGDGFWYNLADFIRGFSDGFIFVMIIVGILYTTNLLNKIKETKRRFFKSNES